METNKKTNHFLLNVIVYVVCFIVLSVTIIIASCNKEVKPVNAEQISAVKLPKPITTIIVLKDSNRVAFVYTDYHSYREVMKCNQALSAFLSEKSYPPKSTSFSAEDGEIIDGVIREHRIYSVEITFE